MKSIVSIIVGLILIAGIGFVVYREKNSEPSLVPQDQSSMTADEEEVEMEDKEDGDNVVAPQTQPQTAPPPSTGGISSATVAAHNSRASCWTTINGNVYDLTSWIPNHPGGEQAILSLCGINGSAKFNAQHGGSQKPLTILAGFKIGVAQ